MGIRGDTYYMIECDACGEAFPEHDLGGFTLYDSAADARLEVEGSDGAFTEDGKVLCADCAYSQPSGEGGG